jgi:Uma2 family endonuclease
MGMSAAPKWPPGTGLHGLRMTADEYLALGETQERYELVDGVVIMSPSPIRRHNKVTNEILGQLRDFAERTNLIEFFSDIDVQFSPALVYRPDISVFRAGRLLSDDSEPLDLPPDLIVEVLSPSTKPFDLNTKRDDYQRFGVGEYWVVDPANGEARCWVRMATKFVVAQVQGNSLISSVIDGFSLDLARVRAVLKPSNRQ